MRYQEFKPSTMLAQWIQCYWIFEGSYSVESWETIVADGFPELIIHAGARYDERSKDDTARSQPRAVIAGQLLQPLNLRSLGDVKIVAIRFLPAGLAMFTRSSARLLTDSRIDAFDLFPEAERLADAVCDAQNDRESTQACERFLLDSLDLSAEHRPVDRAIEIISECGGDLRVEALAERANMSRRSLELNFRDRVGVSPKQFCRIIRFRRAYDLLTEGPTRNAAKAAFDAGFFDQSHLIRDFRQFAGEPPEEFLRQNSPLAHALTAN